MSFNMENNKIDYRLDKCRYACGQLHIRESMHVADGMDECIIAIADKIFPILSRLIDKLNIRNSLSLKGAERENEFERIDNELAEFGLIYSGWNFNPNYIDEMKYNIEHGIVGTPCFLSFSIKFVSLMTYISNVYCNSWATLRRMLIFSQPI